MSPKQLLEECWAKIDACQPGVFTHLGDYAMDIHVSPLDLMTKESNSANLNQMNKETLLSKIEYISVRHFIFN
jgi:hypothetical protein